MLGWAAANGYQYRVSGKLWAGPVEFAWDGGDSSGRERVPVAEFDFETVFRKDEGEVGDRTDEQIPRVPLDQILSPRERLCAFTVVREIIRRASPRSQSTRRSWRDPLVRQRRIEGLRRAIRTPETRRRRLEAAWRARPAKRELLLRLWRERREEFLARMGQPEYRKKMSEMARARWAIPAFRERMLASIRSPEVRRRVSLGMRRYFQEHPEARQQRSETRRRVWQDPAYRKRLSESIRASWAARAAAKRREEVFTTG